MALQSTKPNAALRSWQLNRCLQEGRNVTNGECVEFLRGNGVQVTLATYNAWKGGHRAPAATTWQKVCAVIDKKEEKNK